MQLAIEQHALCALAEQEGMLGSELREQRRAVAAQHEVSGDADLGREDVAKAIDAVVVRRAPRLVSGHRGLVLDAVARRQRWLGGGSAGVGAGQ
jgi:hypothetical protein